MFECLFALCNWFRFSFFVCSCCCSIHALDNAVVRVLLNVCLKYMNNGKLTDEEFEKAATKVDIDVSLVCLDIDQQYTLLLFCSSLLIFSSTLLFWSSILLYSSLQIFSSTLLFYFYSSVLLFSSSLLLCSSTLLFYSSLLLFSSVLLYSSLLLFSSTSSIFPGFWSEYCNWFAPKLPNNRRLKQPVMLTCVDVFFCDVCSSDRDVPGRYRGFNHVDGSCD